jgi:hypothetical protein
MTIALFAFQKMSCLRHLNSPVGKSYQNAIPTGFDFSAADWIFGEKRFEGDFEINGNAIMFRQFPDREKLVDNQEMLIDSARMILYNNFNDSISVRSVIEKFNIEYLQE